MSGFNEGVGLTALRGRARLLSCVSLVAVLAFGHAAVVTAQEAVDSAEDGTVVAQDATNIAQGQTVEAEDATVVTQPEVVVSASRVPVATEQVGSAVTVITAEELEQRQVRIVSDVLRDVPGVAVSRTGPTGAFTQVRIRGAEGNQTLVIIDGIEVNNPAGGSEFDFANLLNSDLARIEVLRGPQSALYGSDAIGGVVNVVSERPEDGFSFLGRGEGGSFNTGSGLINAGYGGEDFYGSATIDHFTTGGISVAEERNGNTEEDGYENTTMRLKGGVALFDDMLEFEAVGYRVDSTRDGDASALIVGAVDSDDTSDTLQHFGLASAKLKLFDGAWEHIARASFVHVDTDFFDGNDNQTFSSNGEKDKFDYQTNLFFSTPQFADAEHTLTFLAEREREDQRSGGATFNNVEIVNYGYAGEYRLGLWDRLFLSGGLRYDDNDDLFDNETTYRATAAYLHRETGTRLHGSVGRGVKNPTLFELFGFTANFTGNPNLEPEKSFGWDVGVEQSFWDDRVLIDVTYFNNEIEDLITGSGNTAINLEGENEIQGIEVSAAAEPIQGLRFDIAYTFTDAEDDNGDDLTRRPKHVASFNANYAFDLYNRPANLNFGVRFSGKQDDTVLLGFGPGQTRTETLDSFTLVNIGASYEIADGISLFARGENLLDDNYQEVVGFGTPGIAGFAGVRIKLGPFGDVL